MEGKPDFMANLVPYRKVRYLTKRVIYILRYITVSLHIPSNSLLIIYRTTKCEIRAASRIEPYQKIRELSHSIPLLHERNSEDMKYVSALMESYVTVDKF